MDLMKTQNLSMTYLGQIDMTRNTKVKAEENVPISCMRLYKRKIVRWYRV